MSPVDYDALAGNAGSGVPADGTHTARLERAALLETDNGSRLITEWSANGTWWESWNRFDGRGMSFTQDLLDGLGVDRSKVTNDDEMGDELSHAEGDTYRVRTESKRGSQGDRWFTSTYIEARVEGGTPPPPRPEPESDAPADTAGLPAPGASAPANDLFGDDDIPF